MTDVRFRKLAVFGVGLIGGSFAMALRQAGCVERVAGVGRSRANLERALELGVIDEVAPDAPAALDGADLVLVAVPVQQTVSILNAIEPHLAPDAVLTDGGSTKRDVVSAARSHLGLKLMQFVPAHPVAGAELSGVEAATAELFRDHTVVLTPVAETGDRARVRVDAAWRACGARTVEMSAERHDEVFAAVSHLPHVLAFTLVEMIASREDAAELFSFAGAGFRDFTRIAAQFARDVAGHLPGQPRRAPGGDPRISGPACRPWLRKWKPETVPTSSSASNWRARPAANGCAASSEPMNAYPPYLDLGPFWHAAGTIRLPGSKSISNRTLLLAALAQGVTEIRDLLSADDVDRMLDALEQLGVRVQRSDPQRVLVTGCSGTFPRRSGDLFLGNAGTVFRPLTAALALNGGHYTLSGAPRMHERPIGDLVDALRALGADIRYLGKEGFPPLEIFPATIRGGGHVRVRADVSSQFLTALLMALPMTGQTMTVEVEGELISTPYIEITLRLLAMFGVRVARDGWASFTIPGDRGYRSPGVVHVEGDASSASYFLAAGAIGGGPVRVEGVGRDSVQGDVRFAEALAQMGAVVEPGENWIETRAPADGRLRAFDLDLNHIPDAAMTLAVAALFADGPCRLRNIASWRVKETDRLSAMATELRKLGAHADEGPDYLVVMPPVGSGLTPHAAINTYDDHRMAMCFSLVALGGVSVRINDPKCVAKTFPDYFERFAEITSRPFVPVIAIDGPSASGKGTVARQVAAALGFHFLDSGALYRLVALAAQRRRIDLTDVEALAALAIGLDCEFRDDQVILDGQDVTQAIRTEGGLRRSFSSCGCARSTAGATRPPARLPPGAGAGGGRARYGLRGVPRRRPQGIPDRQSRGACAAPL